MYFFFPKLSSWTLLCSIRPKPLFWFRSNTDTKTQIGGYIWADNVTDTETRFQWNTPVSIIKRPLIPNLLSNTKYFKLIKTYITPRKGKIWQKFKFFEIILKKICFGVGKKSFSFDQAWLWYRSDTYQNWTLVSVLHYHSEYISK